MAFIRVPNAGSLGVNKDLSDHELPINAWTDCQNIRFLDGYAYQFYGHGEVYNSPSVVPYHVLPVIIGTERYWIYAGAQKVYAVTNTNGVAVHTNITRQETNLLTYSEQFDNAAWVKNNATVTANSTTDPNGGSTADTLTATSSNATIYQTVTLANSPYTFSIYLKRKTGTGTVSITVDGTTLENVTLTSSWVRFDTHLTPTAGSNTVGIKINTNGDEVYAWGAQLEPGTIMGDYVQTTTTSTSADENYSATQNSWTSTLLGGIPVLNPNNGNDYPQRWNLDINSRLVNLENWPENVYCQSMRSYKGYLVAMNITKGTDNYPFMVKWSNPADPGSIPNSWDETNPANDAGEIDLAEGYDPIVDGLQLRDSFMIYKESSVWRMDYVGGPFVFKFQKVLGTSGALNRNCVVEVDGFHFVLTNSDVIVHDGQTSTSVLDKQTRRFLFQDMDVDAVGQAFVFKNPFVNEVFVCYASIGASIPNKAMVWNYKDKTVSFRDIPNLNHAAFGPVDNGLIGNWNQDSDPWDSDLTWWDGPDFTPSTARVIMASNDQKLYLLDASASFDGVIPSAYLERIGLGFDADDKIKLVRGIRPRITGNVGDTVIVKIGSSSDPYATPTYTSMTHTIGSTISNDCLVAGRYIAIRFETGTAYQWRLDSYDLDVEMAGNW